ncbi:MAG TPA: hypothetical protein VGG34_15430 [Opitutaceae bacterium]|jgi:hypothetical protein
MRAAPFALLAAALACGGCQGITYTPLAPLDPRGAAPYAMKGAGSVTGQAYAQSNGDKSWAAGKKVYLVPDLPHFQDWLKRTIVHGNGPNLDPQDSRYVRIAEADDAGSFSFAGVPDGKYVVLVVAYWEYPDPTGNMITKGGPASEEIEVARGAPVQVDLH